jgi:hypothetical protein
MLDAPSAAAPFPKLRLHHLLLLAAITAGYASYDHALNAFIRSKHPSIGPRHATLMDAVNSAIEIVALSGMLHIAGISIWHSWRSRRSNWQAGQWLATFSVLRYLEAVASAFVFDDSLSLKLTLLTNAPGILFSCLWLIAFSRLALFERYSRSWKFAFGVLALRQAVEIAGIGTWVYEAIDVDSLNVSDQVLKFFDVYHVFSRVVEWTLVALATMMDLRRPKERHWGHWMAVSFWLIYWLPWRY